MTHFSAGFVVTALIWSNLLGIQYQQSTRVQQAQLAGGIQGVDAQVRDLGNELGIVKATMATLTGKIDTLLPKISDADAIEISNLVSAGPFFDALAH